jgi:hypothetical protein
VKKGERGEMYNRKITIVKKGSNSLKNKTGVSSSQPVMLKL